MTEIAEMPAFEITGRAVPPEALMIFTKELRRDARYIIAVVFDDPHLDGSISERMEIMFESYNKKHSIRTSVADGDYAAGARRLVRSANDWTEFVALPKWFKEGKSE